MLNPIVLMAMATLAIEIGAWTFTCENSTLLYSVKGQDDHHAFVVFQDRNRTRVFYQDQESGLWNREVDASEHGKSCDFRVITRPVQQHCVTTTDGGNDRDLRMCSEDRVDPYKDQTVAEHMVLVACSSDSSAFAKVANNEGSVHFLAAYHSMEQLEQSIEWNPNNFTATIRNFMRKQTCDDNHDPVTSSATGSGLTTRLLLVVGVALAGFL